MREAGDFTREGGTEERWRSRWLIVLQSIWYNSPLSTEKFVLLNELSLTVCQPAPVRRYQGGMIEIRLGVEETDLAVS